VNKNAQRRELDTHQHDQQPPHSARRCHGLLGCAHSIYLLVDGLNLGVRASPDPVQIAIAAGVFVIAILAWPRTPIDPRLQATGDIATDNEKHATSASAESHPESRRNVFSRLWSGDIRLAATYWLWGGIGSPLAGILTLLAITIFKKELTSNAATGIWITATAVYTALMCVAIWRSAQKYTGRRLWRSAANISVVTTIIIIIVFGVWLIYLISA
jgi:hypothetical protein